jgi:hypothetical protein
MSDSDEKWNPDAGADNEKFNASNSINPIKYDVDESRHRLPTIKEKLCIIKECLELLNEFKGDGGNPFPEDDKVEEIFGLLGELEGIVKSFVTVEDLK